MYRRALLLGCWIALASVAAQAGENDLMRVHFIEVGQGNSTLIEFSNGVMLIDAGGEEALEFNGRKNLLRYLEDFFDRRQDLFKRDNPIDLLAITHPHKDHTCGIPDIINEYPPANIIHNHQRTGSGVDEQNLAVDYIRQGNARGYFIVEDRAVHNVLAKGKGITNEVIDPFGPTGDAAHTDPEVTVLWGGIRNAGDWDQEDLANENNHSLVIRVDYGQASVLFTGDLEEGFIKRDEDRPATDRREGTRTRAGIERMIEAYKKFEVLDADVHLIGHHGSHNGGSGELARAISPEIAVISCGPPVKRRDTKFNAFNFGHPRKEAIDELEAAVTGTRSESIMGKIFERPHRPFERKIDKAIYCTGWDGTIVLEGKADGAWSVKKLAGNRAFR